MDKVLKVSDLTNLSYGVLTDAVRNGFKLQEADKSESLNQYFNIGGKSSVNNKILDVDTLKTIPIENLITLYKQGFRVYEKLTEGCIDSAVQGVSKSFYVSITTEGTSPYTYRLFADDNLIDTYGPTEELSHTFNHVMNETIGTHTYSSDIYDSCPYGVKTSPLLSCTITIISGGTEPTGTQPTGTQPTGTQPTGTQPTGTKPTGTKPITCGKDSINIFGKCIDKKYVYGGFGAGLLGIIGYAAYKENEK